MKAIARRIQTITGAFADAIAEQGHYEILNGPTFFDTIRLRPISPEDTIGSAQKSGMNLRDFGDGSVGISFDETTSLKDAIDLALDVFGPISNSTALLAERLPQDSKIENRKSKFLQNPVFNRYHSETEMLRYIKRLESRDLSLTTSMIPGCYLRLADLVGAEV